MFQVWITYDDPFPGYLLTYNASEAWATYEGACNNGDAVSARIEENGVVLAQFPGEYMEPERLPRLIRSDRKPR